MDNTTLRFVFISLPEDIDIQFFRLIIEPQAWSNLLHVENSHSNSNRFGLVPAYIARACLHRYAGAGGE